MKSIKVFMAIRQIFFGTQHQSCIRSHSLVTLSTALLKHHSYSQILHYNKQRVSSIAFARGSESNKLNTKSPPTLETLRALQAHKSFGGVKPCFPAVQPPKSPPLRL